MDNLDLADGIVVLDDCGHATEQTPMNFHHKTSGSDFGEFYERLNSATNNDRPSDSVALSNASAASRRQIQPSSTPETDRQNQQVARQRGDPSLYSFYLKSIGVWIFVSWIILVGMAAVWEKMPCKSWSLL